MGWDGTALEECFGNRAAGSAIELDAIKSDTIREPRYQKKRSLSIANNEEKQK